MDLRHNCKAAGGLATLPWKAYRDCLGQKTLSPAGVKCICPPISSLGSLHDHDYWMCWSLQLRWLAFFLFVPSFQFDCQAVLRHGFGCFLPAANAVSDDVHSVHSVHRWKASWQRVSSFEYQWPDLSHSQAAPLHPSIGPWQIMTNDVKCSNQLQEVIANMWMMWIDVNGLDMIGQLWQKWYTGRPEVILEILLRFRRSTRCFTSAAFLASRICAQDSVEK